MARIRGILLGRTALCGALTLGVAATVAPRLAKAGPEGTVVVGGSVDMLQTGTHTEFTQHSQTALLNHDSFDIQANESVNFAQPNSGALAINRIVGSDLPTTIAGQLTANGNVWVLNPSGVAVQRGAQVNVGGLLATTASISDEDALSGNYSFAGAPDGSAVTNAGSVTAGEGSVVLVAPIVENSGTISATGSDVALGAGSGFTVDFAGDGLTRFQVTPGEGVSVSNTGAIAAEGGAVYISAASAEAVQTSVVSVGGTVEATRIEEKGGVIYISGGESGVTEVSGTVDASQDEGVGGNVVVTGEKIDIAATAVIDASGASGGGTVEIGGAYQGGAIASPVLAGAGAPDGAPLPTSRRTLVREGARIAANAGSEGDGGTVIVWSDEVTGFYGTIEATGGALSGDGGFAEVSGKEYLAFDGMVDLSAPFGGVGTLLLDPRDITIVADGDDDDELDGDPANTVLFGDGANANDDFTISAGAISDANSAVLLQATRNISVNASVDADQDLTFEANQDISIGNNVTLKTSGDLTLSADHDGAGGGSPGDITWGGGNSAIEGANVTLSAGEAIQLGRLTASGNLSVDTSSNNAEITQNGVVSVSGTTSLNAGTADITLGNNDNEFVGAVSATGDDILLDDTTNLVLGAIGAGGTLDLEADGNIADSGGGIAVAEGTTLRTGGNIALDDAINDFVGTVSVVGTPGTITIRDANTLTAGQMSADTAITLGATTAVDIVDDVTAPAITIENLDGGGIGLGATDVDGFQITDAELDRLVGHATLDADGNIVVDGATTNRNVTLDAGGDVTFATAASEFDDLAVLAGGDILFGAGAPLTLTGALDLTTAGIIDFDAASAIEAGSVAFDIGGATTDFSDLSLTASGPVAVAAQNVEAVDDATLTGLTALTLTQRGDVEVGSAGVDVAGLETAGVQTLTVRAEAFGGETGAISVDGATSTETVILQAAAGIAFTGTTSSFDVLSATALGGNITQGVAITLSGGGEFAATDGSDFFDIALGQANTIGGPVDLVGDDILIRSSTALTLGGVDARGGLTVTAAGIADSGEAISVDALASFNGGAGAVDLDGAAHDFTSVSASGGTISLRDQDAITLAGISAGGNFSLSAGGAVTQSGAVSVGGTTGVTTTGDAVTLGNFANNFGGSVSVDTTGGGAAPAAVTLADANLLTLGNLRASGLTVSADDIATAVGGDVRVGSDTGGGDYDGTIAVTNTSGGAVQIGGFGDLNDAALDITEADIDAWRFGTLDVNAAGLSATLATLDVTSGGVDATKDISLTASDLAVTGPVNLGSGTLRLASAGNDVLFGFSAFGFFSADNLELAFIEAGSVQVDSGTADTHLFGVTSLEEDLSVEAGDLFYYAGNTGFGDLTVAADSIVSFFDSSLNLGGNTLTATLTQGATLTGLTAGALSVNAGTSVDFVGTNSIGGHAGIEAGGSVDFNTSTSSFGSLTVGSSTAITQLDGGSVTVTGTTSLDSSGNVDLLGNTNDLAGIDVDTPGDLTLDNVDALALGTVSVGGNAVITAGGTVTDTDGEKITIDGTTSITAVGGLGFRDIVLDNDGADIASFGGALSLVGQDVLLNTGAVTLGSVTTVAGGIIDPTIAGNAGSLTVTAAGTISDTAGLAILVAGPASLTAADGGTRFDIALDNGLHDFDSDGDLDNNGAEDATDAVAVTGDTVTLTDRDAIRLGAVSAEGNLSVTAAGSITDTDGEQIDVNGTTTLSAQRTGEFYDIALDSPDLHAFGGAVSATGEDIVLDSAGAVVLGAVDANLGGAAGDTTADFTVALFDNDGNGVLGGADPAARGDLTVRAGGSITDTAAAIDVEGRTRLEARNAAGTTFFEVALDGASHNFDSDAPGAQAIDEVDAVGASVTLRDTGAIALGAVGAGGALTVSAGGAITDTPGEAILVNGGTSLTTVSDIVLDNVATHDFDADGDANNDGAEDATQEVDASGASITLSDRDAIRLGDITAAGNLTVSAGGSITDTDGDALDVSGTTTLLARNAVGTDWFDIRLDGDDGNGGDRPHSFTGAVSAAGEDILIDSGGAIMLGTISANAGGAAGDAGADSTIGSYDDDGDGALDDIASAGDLTVRARGAITDAGAPITVEGRTRLEARNGGTFYDISLGSAAMHDFDADAAGPGATDEVDAEGGDILISDANAIALGQVTTHANTDPTLAANDGSLTVVARGSIADTDGEAVAVRGATSLVAVNDQGTLTTFDDDYFDIVLDNAGLHDLDSDDSGDAVSATGEDIVIDNADAIVLGAIDANLDFSADATLATFDANGDGVFDLGEPAARGDLTVRAGGAITDTALSIDVEGRTRLQATGGITLDGDDALAGDRPHDFDSDADVDDNGAEDASEGVYLAGTDVVLVDRDSLALGAASVSGDLSVEVGGSTTDTADEAIVVDGHTTVVARRGADYFDIAWDNPGLHDFNTVELEGEGVAIADANDLAVTSIRAHSDGANDPTLPGGGSVSIMTAGALDIPSGPAGEPSIVADGDVTATSDGSITFGSVQAGGFLSLSTGTEFLFDDRPMTLQAGTGMLIEAEQATRLKEDAHFRSTSGNITLRMLGGLIIEDTVESDPFLLETPGGFSRIEIGSGNFGIGTDDFLAVAFAPNFNPFVAQPLPLDESLIVVNGGFQIAALTPSAVTVRFQNTSLAPNAGSGTTVTGQTKLEGHFLAISMFGTFNGLGMTSAALGGFDVSDFQVDNKNTVNGCVIGVPSSCQPLGNAIPPLDFPNGFLLGIRFLDPEEDEDDPFTNRGDEEEWE